MQIWRTVHVEGVPPLHIHHDTVLLHGTRICVLHNKDSSSHLTPASATPPHPQQWFSIHWCFMNVRRTKADWVILNITQAFSFHLQMWTKPWDTAANNFTLPTGKTGVVRRTMYEWNLLLTCTSKTNCIIQFKILLRQHLLKREI